MYIVPLTPPPYPLPPFSPSLISLMVSVDVKHHVYFTGGDRGPREIIYLSLHCHHQNDPCIKMGSDESHFNVSLIVRVKVTKTVSTNHIY